MSLAALLAIIPRQVANLGLLLGFAGGLIVALAAAAFLFRPQDDSSRRRERILTLIGASLIAAAFLALFVVRVFLQ